MIDVEELSYTYARAPSPAIEDLSFKVEPQEIFGFLGPSGAGKSTTQRILIGLLADYRGRVAVFGKDIAQRNSDYYERIGVSFEFPNHFGKLTARENLNYFGALYARRKIPLESLLGLVGLSGDADMLVSRYSKGMKTRLSVARALLHDPELLVLDEPTAGLDPNNARRIKDLVRAQCEAGKTVFLTTHDMTVADELCDRVAFIVDGKIRLVGVPGKLKLDHGAPRVRVEFANGGRVEHRDFSLEGLGDDVEFVKALRDHSIRTIHTQEATLEDVFIEVTGKELV